MQIDIIPCGDNCIYLLTDQSRAAVVDPTNARLVLNALKSNNVSLERMLVTHGHQDHTGGCAEIEKATGIRMEKPREATATILDREVRIIPTPGHTQEDVCYFFPGEKIAFTGDTLFKAGCGRVFTGDYARMWNSLLKLRDLPPDTQIYCGHDYARENLEFALGIEPENREVLNELDTVNNLRATGSVCVPSTMEKERKTNPFLRADTEDIQSALARPGISPLESFTLLRKRKDAA